MAQKQNNAETYRGNSRPDDNHLMPIKKVPASIISFWCIVSLVFLALGILIPDDIPNSWEEAHLLYKVFLFFPPGFIFVYIHTIKQKY